MVTLAGAAQADLISRGNGMIYDTTRNITWLANMDVNGLMNWNAANDWADNLVFGGFSDWRLPTLKPDDESCTGFLGVDFDFNCTGGELSGLFVADLGYITDEFGLIAGDDTTAQIANLALFSNVQSDYYWSGTEYAPPSGSALSFSTVSGRQTHVDKNSRLSAVAVRPGDVPAAVPEPQTLALVLLALGATVLARRTRSA